MPFCANCGAVVEGRYCPKCGSAINATGSGATPDSSSYGTATGVAAAPATAGMSENVAGALCYLLGLITGVLFLVIAPYNQNRNVRFHAFQSIFFNVAMIAAWIAFMVIGTILAHIPILGWIIDLLVWAALSIGALIIWLMLMFKAYNNQRLSLPVIGPLAEKQAAA
jgi:uncharacterized membrane protein